MKVPPESPWAEYPDQLKELMTKAKRRGLTVQLDHDVYFPDAKLFDGDQLICWVHYDPNEDLWASEQHSRFVCPLTEILDYYKNGQHRRLVLFVDYPSGKVPEADDITEEMRKAIKKLLPGKPGEVHVG